MKKLDILILLPSIGYINYAMDTFGDILMSYLVDASKFKPNNSQKNHGEIQTDRCRIIFVGIDTDSPAKNASYDKTYVVEIISELRSITDVVLREENKIL